MTENIFWQLIDKAKKSGKGDFGEACEKLTGLLKKQSVDDIVSFENTLNKKLKAATTYEMLLACFIVNSYISDDTFESFCAWLIGQGKSDYERAIADPNHFCNLLDKGDESNQDGEYLTAVSIEAFEEKTNKDGDEFLDMLESIDEPDIKRLTTIDIEAYRKTLPLLFEKFWNQEKIDNLYNK
ncbi:DUF4240 domain-containing protein [Ferruginibacter sp.]